MKALQFDVGELHWAGKFEARRVNRETTQKWFSDYHYSGTVGRVSHSFGVFAGDLIAVVGFGNGNVQGLAKKFHLEEFPGDWEIARVAVHPDAPRNTASQALSLAVSMFTRELGLDWVYSYADSGEGHHGGIYQAINAVYVGVSLTTPWYVVDGERMHSRMVWDQFKTNRQEHVAQVCAEAGWSFRMEPGTDKHCYIIPAGGPATRRKIRRVLVSFEMPYPKREMEISDD